MLDSILRDVAAKKESSLTELEQAIAGQKSDLLTAQASANTNIAGLISGLYGSAFDNAPDASMWAQLATQAQAAPKATVSSRGMSSSLSSMTDTMSKTTPSTGVSAPREAVMVTGTPSGKTWGSESMNVPQSTSPAQGGVRWEDNVLTNEPMKSEPEQPAASEYGGGAINKALGSDWLTSSEGTTPLENLLKPANPSEMLPENRNATPAAATPEPAKNPNVETKSIKGNSLMGDFNAENSLKSLNQIVAQMAAQGWKEVGPRRAIKGQYSSAYWTTLEREKKKT
jgi:hypothetical protein